MKKSPSKKLDKPKTKSLTESEKRGYTNYNTNKVIPVTGSKGTRQSTKFAPQTPKQAKQEKQAIANQKKKQNQSRIRRVLEGVASGGMSEIQRFITKSDVAKKVVKSLKNTPPFKMRSGNKPSIAKLAGIEGNKKRKDIFLTPETPGKPVNDKMPQMGIEEFKKFIEKNKNQKKINDKFLINPDFSNKKVIGSHTITKDIKKRK